jgi:hypothetical protein
MMPWYLGNSRPFMYQWGWGMMGFWLFPLAVWSVLWIGTCFTPPVKNFVKPGNRGFLCAPFGRNLTSMYERNTLQRTGTKIGKSMLSTIAKIVRKNWMAAGLGD